MLIVGGPLVNAFRFDARHADLVGEVHPVGLGDRDVMVGRSADADFLDQRR